LQIRDLISPGLPLGEASTLSDALGSLERGAPVFFQSQHGLRLLMARHAVGYAPSRRLIDLPSDPAKVVDARADIDDLPQSTSEAVAVEDAGQVIGWLSPQNAVTRSDDPGESSIVPRLLGPLLHDCGNALMMVTAALEGVERDATLDATATAQSSVGYVADLVKRIQSMCAGNADAPAAVQLAELIDELSGLLSLVCGPNVRLTQALQGSLPPVLAYRSGLERVLLNLVTNACDALGRRGRLRISARSEPAQPLLETEVDSGERGSAAPVAAGERRVVLVVEDDGPGIPPALAERVFDLGVSSKPGGARGMGLAGARQALARMGASIEVGDSALGGARFEVRLRVATMAG
jgi:signal transduction histidine kinase